MKQALSFWLWQTIGSTIECSKAKSDSVIGAVFALPSFQKMEGYAVAEKNAFLTIKSDVTFRQTKDQAVAFSVKFSSRTWLA